MARHKKAQPPTVEEVLEKFRDAEAYWKQTHANMGTGYRIFNLDLEVTAPDGYDVIYPATGNTIVMTGADHVAGDAARVDVPEAGLSKRAQERSEALTKGFQAALYRMDAVSTESPIRTLTINGFWSGMMVAKGPIFDSSAWGLVPVESDYGDGPSYEEAKGDYESTKKTEWPFIWKAIDPRHVYADPGTTGKEWVIVSYERTAGSIKAEWPDWDMRFPGSDKPILAGTKVAWLEFWNTTHRLYLVGNVGTKETLAFYNGGKPVDKVRGHRYGKPPFQIRSAGYGVDSGEPHERFRSLFWGAESLLKAEIRAYSHRDALIRKTAWSTMVAPISSGFDSMKPGEIKQVPVEFAAPGLIRSVTEIQPAAIQAVTQEIDEIDAAIQAATVPNVVQGIKARGIASGYGQNSLVAQAKVRYGAVARNLKSLLEETLVDLGHCVEDVVEEELPIWGHTKWGVQDAVLKPSDIDGLKYVVVTINPKLPADRANEIEMGGVLVDRGAIDLDTYVQDFVGYENPGEMRERVLRDRALQDPAIMRVLALAAALKGGYIDYVMDAATQIGMDPGQLLAVLGFGNPSQQSPAANQGAGDPRNVAAQRQGGEATVFSGAQKAQPGSPSAVRDAAVPGLPIGA